MGGFNVLVDPILVGNLDFGIPWLYDAAKRFLKKFTVINLPISSLAYWILTRFREFDDTEIFED